MAFVYQKLTKEDKEYLKSFKIPYQFGGGGYAEILGDAPIDRDRNIYLFYVQGLGDMKLKNEKEPAVYYLVWDGDLIKFALFYDDSKRDENDMNIHIYIYI